MEWDIVTRVLGGRGGYQCRGNGRWSYEGFEWNVVSLGMRVGEREERKITRMMRLGGGQRTSESWR